MFIPLFDCFFSWSPLCWWFLFWLFSSLWLSIFLRLHSSLWWFFSIMTDWYGCCSSVCLISFLLILLFDWFPPVNSSVWLLFPIDSSVWLSAPIDSSDCLLSSPYLVFVLLFGDFFILVVSLLLLVHLVVSHLPMVLLYGLTLFCLVWLYSILVWFCLDLLGWFGFNWIGYDW
jgi:hypothetical protein